MRDKVKAIVKEAEDDLIFATGEVSLKRALLRVIVGLNAALDGADFTVKGEAFPDRVVMTARGGMGVADSFDYYIGGERVRHKIDAIKKYRALTGAGLKDSLDYVNALERAAQAQGVK